MDFLKMVQAEIDLATAATPKPVFPPPSTPPPSDATAPAEPVTQPPAPLIAEPAGFAPPEPAVVLPAEPAKPKRGRKPGTKSLSRGHAADPPVKSPQGDVITFTQPDKPSEQPEPAPLNPIPPSPAPAPAPSTSPFTFSAFAPAAPPTSVIAIDPAKEGGERTIVNGEVYENKDLTPEIIAAGTAFPANLAATNAVLRPDERPREERERQAEATFAAFAQAHGGIVIPTPRVPKPIPGTLIPAPVVDAVRVIARAFTIWRPRTDGAGSYPDTYQQFPIESNAEFVERMAQAQERNRTTVNLDAAFVEIPSGHPLERLAFMGKLVADCPEALQRDAVPGALFRYRVGATARGKEIVELTHCVRQSGE